MRLSKRADQTAGASNSQALTGGGGALVGGRARTRVVQIKGNHHLLSLSKRC